MPQRTSGSVPKRYERSAGRKDTRADHCERTLHTNAGEVTLKVPKLHQLKFETAIIERYQRRESSVEEALIEMYLAGSRPAGSKTSPRPLGIKVSPSTVSKLNQRVYEHFERWRNRPIETRFRAKRRGPVSYRALATHPHQQPARADSA